MKKLTITPSPGKIH